MNKLLAIGLSLLTISINLPASDKKLDAVKIKEVTGLNKVLQQPNLHIQSGIDKGSIYFLKVN